MKKKPLKVGFDLDGVLLYNPARIIRAPVTRFKHKFIPKREKVFYIPQSEPEQFMWEIFHLSSLFIAPGFENIRLLKDQGLIEPYIVTARFKFMEHGFKRWLQKINADKTFEGAFLNENNQQPHLYKERLVKRLNLDIFIEDNWNIVEHLSKKSPVKPFWVYNIFDRQIDYTYKFPSLKKAIERVHEEAKK